MKGCGSSLTSLWIFISKFLLQWWKLMLPVSRSLTAFSQRSLSILIYRSLKLSLEWNHASTKTCTESLLLWWLKSLLLDLSHFPAFFFFGINSLYIVFNLLLTVRLLWSQLINSSGMIRYAWSSAMNTVYILFQKASQSLRNSGRSILQLI